MIKTKIITDIQLLQIFQKNYFVLANNNVDLDYLKGSKVRIFYRGTEENMVAGYCIHSGPNYRTFLPLNETVLQKLKHTNKFNQYPPHEICCLWIEKTSRSAIWVLFVFLMLVKDLLRLKKGLYIFGTHGQNVNSYFAHSFPKIIFFDRIFVATKNETCDFWIRKGNKFDIIKGFILLGFLRLTFGYNALYYFRSRYNKKN